MKRVERVPVLASRHPSTSSDSDLPTTSGWAHWLGVAERSMEETYDDETAATGVLSFVVQGGHVAIRWRRDNGLSAAIDAIELVLGR